MSTTEQRYHQLLEPSDILLNDLAKIHGDIIVLGAGGKMGPALCRLAKLAVNKAGIKKKIIAVSRFSEQGLEASLNELGIITHAADLLDENDLQQLPLAENVLYLAGQKFGTSGNESLTWAMNSYLPGRVAEKYRNANIVVFSTGNVYPLTPITYGGSKETDLPGPIGEYAQSCLGRERIFQYFGAKYHSPLFIYRLNYANDLRYGVLLEIAKSVYYDHPIDLRMGYVNVIWQGDANEIALRALLYCTDPAEVVNVTGPQLLSVRAIAEQFGNLMKKTPLFLHEEETTALLSDAGKSTRMFGKGNVSVNEMLELLFGWVTEGGSILNKPTHFQERSGQF